MAWLQCSAGGKLGFIDADGVERVPPRYDFARLIGRERAFVRDSQGARVLDGAGNVVFEIDAQVMMPFREGLAAFTSKGSWGFVNASGEVVVAPSFDAVFVGHVDGVVRVMDRRGRQFLVDREGKEVSFDAKEIRQSPRNGLVAYQGPKKKWGLFSVRTREVVVEPTMTEVFGEHGEHWILKKAAKKWGAANADGMVVIEPKLPWLGPICEDRGATRDASGAVGFVDAMGTVVVEHQFESRGTQENMSFFANGRCAVQKKGLIGFVNVDGELVIAPRWTNGFAFGEDRGVVVDQGGWTYIDEHGDPITDARFKRAETFFGGIGVVTAAAGQGAVRRDGVLVIPPVCRSVSAAEGVIHVKDSDGRRAYYRADGSCIWKEPDFSLELAPALV